MITATRSTPADAFELTLTEDDIREVVEGWRERLAETPNAVSFRDEEGRLIAIGGVFTATRSAHPWLLSSPLIANHTDALWRTARRVVKHLRQCVADGDCVVNFISTANTRGQRFVEALGFRVVPSERPGFHAFYLPAEAAVAVGDVANV